MSPLRERISSLIIRATPASSRLADPAAAEEHPMLAALRSLTEHRTRSIPNHEDNR